MSNRTVETNLATRDASFRSLEQKYDLVESLKGGTDSMRYGGQKWLPKAEAERDVDYQNRLMNSTLFNYYWEAVMNATYAITSQDVDITSPSGDFDDFATNTSLDGRSIEQFGFDVIKNSIHFGVSYIFIDYLESGHAAITGRPYFVDIKPTQVLQIESERFQGSETLKRFRYMETINDDRMDSDNFTSKEFGTTQKIVDRIREYELDTSGKTPIVKFTVWQRTGSSGWQTVEEGTMEGQTRIPVVPVYSNRAGFYVGSPTFYNLAELNLRHYQSYSDQSNLLHYARFPILFAKGIDMMDEHGNVNKIEIGANTVKYTDNPNADLQFVEHTGAAVESGWKDLDILKEEMMKYVQSISDAHGSLTETQANVMSARMRNTFDSITRQYEIALQQALVFAAEYLELNTIPEITISKQTTPEVETQGNNDE